MYIPQKKLNIKSLRAIVKAADMTLINVNASLIKSTPNDDYYTIHYYFDY